MKTHSPVLLRPLRLSLATFLALLLAGCDQRPSPETARDDPDAVERLTLPYGCNGTTAASPLVASTPIPPTTRSMARYWNEAILDAIRTDLPMPTVHARNLFHLSLAMYDAWAVHDDQAVGYFHREKHSYPSPADRDMAIAFAAYRMLEARYVRAAFPEITLDGLRQRMTALGYDPCYIEVGNHSPAALGNAIARITLDATLDDGSNESGNYHDTTGWLPDNPVLVMADADIVMEHPDQFQLLQLELVITQNGIPQDETLQTYIGPHWGRVRPFALQRSVDDRPYFAPAPLPRWESPEMRDWIVDVIARQRAMDSTDDTRIDISPGGTGNNPLGTNDGDGYPLNPRTGAPYAPQVVPRSDYVRAIAEYWADGPYSETPPGHWNAIANVVTDKLDQLSGPSGIDTLEWDVSLYLALNGALHDAAIAAWEIKREHLSARPVSLIRYRAALGQSSNPELPGYHPDGLPLVEGLIELISTESSQPGERHAHLKAYPGELAIRGWLGEVDRRTSEANVGWVRGRLWIPYQPSTFVTPAFPGYVSGHSTFSHAAAAVLATVTGDPYFPDGLLEHLIEADNGLEFEPGPSEALRLQWATYFDAADQSGDSRLWGGIHILPDDLEGRRIGHQIGLAAVDEAADWLGGSTLPH